MATAGPNSPSSGTTIADEGYAWTNPGNTLSSNNSYAQLSGSSSTSDSLVATSFGFAIPAGATILGITVEVERKLTSGTPQDKLFQLRLSGVNKGTAKSPETALPASDTYKSQGSASDLWGTTWTVANINDSTFGVRVKYNTGSSYGVDVDHIRITVDYSTTTPASLVLSTIAATAALTNRLSAPARLAPSTIAAQSALTNLLRSPTMLSLSQIAAQSALTNLLSAKVLLVPSTIAAQSALPNLLVGSLSKLTLSTIAAQSSLNNLTIVTAPGALILSAIASQSALTGAVISQSFLTLSAIAALSSLSNLVLAAPVLIVPSGIAGVSAVTLDRLSAATLLALSAIAGQSALSNLALGAPALLGLSEIAAQSALTAKLVDKALLTLSSIDALSALTVVIWAPSTLQSGHAQIGVGHFFGPGLVSSGRIATSKTGSGRFFGPQPGVGR